MAPRGYLHSVAPHHKLFIQCIVITPPASRVRARAISVRQSTPRVRVVLLSRGSFRRRRAYCHQRSCRRQPLPPVPNSKMSPPSAQAPDPHDQVQPQAQTNNAVPNEHTPLLSTQAPTVTTANDDDSPELTWREMFAMVWPHVIPRGPRNKVLAVLAIVAMFCAKILNLLPPLAIKLAVDTITNNAALPAERATAPFLAIVAYFIISLLRAAVETGQKVSSAVVTADTQRRFAVNIFRHLHSLSLSYHLRRKTGEVTRVMDRGVRSVVTLLNVFLFTLTPTLFETVLVSLVFFRVGAPGIAATTLIAIVLYFVFTINVTRWRVKIQRQLIKADNAMSERAVETLINFETVLTFGRTSDEIEHYNGLSHVYQQKSVLLTSSLQLLNLGQGAIRLFGLCCGLMLAGYATVHGNPRIGPGDFIAIQLYILQLFQPLSWLGSTYRTVTNAMTDFEKAATVLKLKPEVVDRPNAVTWEVASARNEAHHGEIVFENVSFRYKTDTSQDASGGVSNVSFRVAPGRTLALVGESGSGKSTIMRLLLRMYDVQSGRILVNGVDVRDYSQESLRRNIGVVAQDTVLFNDSLRNNISFGKAGASDAEIYSAVHASALSSFIENQEEKLDTKVGERGLRLSGGERQRVGAARCIIKQPSIVLLDEATSALDTKTERAIQGNMEDLSEGRTTVAIAHRLSTVVNADEILVMGNSTIEERGTHEELLQLGGKYAAMWKMQTEQAGTTSSIGSSGTGSEED